MYESPILLYYFLLFKANQQIGTYFLPIRTELLEYIGTYNNNIEG